MIVEDGTYSGDFRSCTGHESYAQNVVFKPEPGHECPMSYPNIPSPWSDTSCQVNLNPGGHSDGINLGGGSNSSCGVTAGNPLPSSLSAAQRSAWINHLTIQGMYIGDFFVRCAAFIELDNDAGSHFFIGQGAYHVYIQGGDYANETDASQPTIGDTTCGCGNWPPAEDVHVSGAVVHDFVTTSPSHGDGFFIAPSYGVQIVKNVLARNDCIPVYVNYLTGNGQPVGVHGLRVIGNVVHTDTMHNGGDRCYQGISLGNNNQTDTIVAFNTLELPIRRSNSTETNQSIRIVGNIAEGVNALNSGNSWGCGSGTTAAYNILMNSSVSNCGDASNAIGATLPFVSADAQPNSPAGTNQYFTAPLGDYTIASGSAGAPAVGKVPTSWCNANPGVCPTTDINGNPRPNAAHPSYYDAGAYENR